MLDFSVAIAPLVVLSLVNFVLSWVWYSPLLFATPWMKALGMDGKHEMSEAEKKAMPWLFVNGFVASLLVVYGMMVLVNSIGAASFAQGSLVGLVVWAGFALTHSLNTLWEGRKSIVLVINNGLFLLSYVLYGGILAVWK
ncbi:MAG: hypothetical protein A2Y38_24355 [Spirochaetes bacterium GWB1_59_5]|nr:MAG: hypothetical protein A2Y38_24355 [Spirochaetes bacterium GWB1_59_5]